jgi:hypothetical protein
MEPNSDVDHGRRKLYKLEYETLVHSPQGAYRKVQIEVIPPRRVPG